MMKVRILYCLFFVGVITAGVCNAAPLNSDEKEARTVVQRTSLKMFNLFDKSTQATLELQETEQFNDFFQKINDIRRQWAEIVDELNQFDSSKFSDPELKYIFKTIRKKPVAVIAALDDHKFSQLLVLNEMLYSTVSDRNIPAYRNESIELVFNPDIEDIFAKSNDPEELKYYWKIWRKTNAMKLAGYFMNVFELLKEAAQLNEITLLEFWLGEYNVTEMENVMIQIKPFYLQLHGFIRKQLHKKYGDSVIQANGPIPHHLFEQVLAQVWTSGSVIDDIYPHKDLSAYDSILKQNNYDTLKMYKSADQFYQSLGLNPIPDEYWGNNFKMHSNKNEVHCETDIFTFSTNVTMRYCQKMDFGEFLKAHGYMGEVYYTREKSNLPAYYRESHDLQYSVEKSVALSASTPKHLNSIGLVSELKFTEAVKMNRLLRKGIQSLLTVPVNFVYTKVLNELFAGSVEFEDLNLYFWKMMDKYVGVGPPVDRGSGFDFPFKFFPDIVVNTHPREFMTEVLGYQFYEKLCEISGQYSRSIKSEPLNNCDFYGSKKAGDALKKLMGLGSSKPLREVLATVLPEDPAANAESLIEYYAPMKSWLIKKNGEDNVVVGWTHSDRKISNSSKFEDEDQMRNNLILH